MRHTSFTMPKNNADKWLARDLKRQRSALRAVKTDTQGYAIIDDVCQHLKAVENTLKDNE